MTQKLSYKKEFKEFKRRIIAESLVAPKNTLFGLSRDHIEIILGIPMPMLMESVDIKLQKRVLCEQFLYEQFLKNIGHSSCFKDSVLLTKAECEDTRIFTQKVHLKLYENLLKKFELENDTSNSNSTEGVSNEENDEERKKIINEQDGGRRKQRLPSIGGFKSLHL